MVRLHLREFRESEKGQWAIANCKEITMELLVSTMLDSNDFVLTGYVEPEAATDFKLRWT